MKADRLNVLLEQARRLGDEERDRAYKVAETMDQVREENRSLFRQLNQVRSGKEYAWVECGVSTGDSRSLMSPCFLLPTFCCVLNPLPSLPFPPPFSPPPPPTSMPTDSHAAGGGEGGLR